MDSSKKNWLPVTLIILGAFLSMGYSGYQTIYKGDVILTNTEEEVEEGELSDMKVLEDNSDEQ